MSSTFTNRLSLEKSPYLLQHQHNPINWYPWGDEAFEIARSKNVPIFLSVGYSTCHWCHVMEKESFENEEIADYLNEHYVSIKVDREERPDIDKLYMTFIVSMTGRGGWPMSVFLTPDLAPITGGTYFPPDDTRGMSGFPTILRKVTTEWQKSHKSICTQSNIIMNVMKSKRTAPGDVRHTDDVCRQIFNHKMNSFDSKHGGFGTAPKFPKASDLDFLISFASLYPSSDRGKMAVDMLTTTLKAMSLGGIHDHIGKGFHRYSVDKEWHVPHFEKMLYDQAQLLATYSDFHRFSNQKHLEIRKTIIDIFDYMMGSLSHEEGGFYAAEDADSFPTTNDTKKMEGAFCVWEYQEVKNLIDDDRDFELFCEYFDIEEEGNVSAAADPHDELKNKNILRRLWSDEECCEKLGISQEELNEKIEKMKKKLAEARKLRPAPHLDTKMVTAWQGLAITGLVKGFQALKDERMLKRAIKCEEFVEKWLRNSGEEEEDRTLRRVVYRGESGEVEMGNSPSKAFSDDYAFYIQGLLDLYSVTGNEKYLKNAMSLQKIMDRKFFGENLGYYISEENDGEARMFEDQDGAEPTATSIASNNLLRLGDILEREYYRKKAYECFKGSAERLNKTGIALPKMALAHNRWQTGSTTVVMVGEKEAELIQAAREELDRKFVPNVSPVFIESTDCQPSFGISHQGMARSAKPAIYVCKKFVCDRPIKDLDNLHQKFEEL